MTAIWNKKARRYAGCAAAVALAFVLAVVSGCEEQKTIEPARPGSRGPTAVPAGEVRAVELPAEIVAVLEALTWTEEERDILAAVRDGDRQWRETGFFVAMQRARKVPPLPREVFSSLDSPSYSSLLLEPARYRGRPMRILANVVSVEKAEPGKDFALSRRWTRQDGPLWQIIALNSQAEYPGDEPFQIFCAFDPVSRLDLGRPSKTINGRAIYLFKKKSVRQIAVAGVFYKIFREMDLGDRDRPAKMTSYPIVLAWQMHAVGPQAGGQPVDTRTPIIFLVVLGLAVAYVFLRRATSRARSQTQPRRSYAPRRGSKPPAEDAPSQDSPRETTSGDNVDPLLREAAQQYRREKGLDDGQDRPGRTGPA